MSGAIRNFLSSELFYPIGPFGTRAVQVSLPTAPLSEHTVGLSSRGDRLCSGFSSRYGQPCAPASGRAKGREHRWQSRPGVCSVSPGAELCVSEQQGSLAQGHHHALWVLNLCQITPLNFPLINGTPRSRGAGTQKVGYPSGLCSGDPGASDGPALEENSPSLSIHQHCGWSQHVHPALPTELSCHQGHVLGEKNPKRAILLLSKLAPALQRHEQGSASQLLGLMASSAQNVSTLIRRGKKQPSQAPQNSTHFPFRSPSDKEEESGFFSLFYPRFLLSQEEAQPSQK